jgi:PAS domain S-box-containing protein
VSTSASPSRGAELLPLSVKSEELAYRLRQQEILASFGVFALQSRELGPLLHEAGRISASGLGSELAKVLEYRPEADTLLVRAGVGWRPGVVGHATVEADLGTAAGYAFRTGESILSSHLGAPAGEGEDRFRASKVMVEHGIRRAINVQIRGREAPYGVLEVDSPQENKFTLADIAFLEGVANILGVALERTRIEAVVHESEVSFRTLANSIPQLAWMADPCGSIYWYNQRVLDYTGVTLEEIRGWGWRILHHPDHLDRVTERIKRSFDTGEPWEDTFPLKSKDGTYRWFLSRALPIKDSEGKILRWFGTNTDITDQREAEERQHLITQEVSHRVKNSLALVASLLGLQSRSSTSAETKQALEDAYARVQTIAQIHDRLWRQYDARSVDLCGFLNDLCHKLQETAVEHRIEFHGQSVTISTDRAISLGLLLNEIVTNAFKYAYPEGGGGPVDVRLTTGNGILKLEVADQGIGLPEGFDFSQRRQSLGSRLITNTARQLQATVEAGANSPSGARLVITMPVEMS